MMPSSPSMGVLARTAGSGRVSLESAVSSLSQEMSSEPSRLAMSSREKRRKRPASPASLRYFRAARFPCGSLP